MAKVNDKYGIMWLTATKEIVFPQLWVNEDLTASENSGILHLDGCDVSYPSVISIETSNNYQELVDFIANNGFTFQQL